MVKTLKKSLILFYRHTVEIFPLTSTWKINEKIHSLVGDHAVADTFMPTLSKHRLSYIFYNNCVHFSTWRKRNKARTSVCSSSSITSAMSQIVKFYIKAILGFLTIPDDTGASCDHSF